VGEKKKDKKVWRKREKHEGEMENKKTKKKKKRKKRKRRKRLQTRPVAQLGRNWVPLPGLGVTATSSQPFIVDCKLSQVPLQCKLLRKSSYATA